jgi:hypothetical protein
VYYYVVFMFFLPLVFIGAFFLLNLTLAVINSTYSDTIHEIKRKKEKALEEANKLNLGGSGNNEDDDLMDALNAENEARVDGIGV